ncbi:hypothetical protein [Phytopseudomonas seleniipraecipitans]|uniref:hypothetical protein n=1 Tax=Phytopseudomonas seleniipraecipitans TaxID=640205 RepID=UPI00115F8D9B|nr:hypothetical protein [Pseudomonas seleniipraecipitans]
MEKFHGEVPEAEGGHWMFDGVNPTHDYNLRLVSKNAMMRSTDRTNPALLQGARHAGPQRFPRRTTYPPEIDQIAPFPLLIIRATPPSPNLEPQHNQLCLAESCSLSNVDDSPTGLAGEVDRLGLLE